MSKCETSIDLGFGSLDFYPGITSEEIRRIHTVTKEMTIEEIEEKLGYKIKIVNNNKVSDDEIIEDAKNAIRRAKND